MNFSNAFLLLILGVFLIGCVQNQEESIKIGWMGPVTGQSAVLGMDSVTAAEMAVEKINSEGGVLGKQLELVVEDDKYDTAQAMSSYQKLVNVNNIDFILASTYSGVIALAPSAKRDQVLLLDPLDCSEEIIGLNENVFCLATESKGIAQVISEEALKRKYKTVGILFFNSDTFMPLMKRYSTEILEANEVQVFSDAHAVGTKDFKTVLIKMMDENVEALFLLGYDETGIIMKQARALGFNGQFFTTGTVTSPALLQTAQGTANGTILAFWEADKTQEPTKSFTNAFMQKKGRPPALDLATYPSYDAVLAIAHAIQDAGTTDVSIVADKLRSLRDLQGVTGTVSFLENGSAPIQEKAFQLMDGKVVALTD